MPSHLNIKQAGLNFRGYDLRGADFTDCDLRGCDFSYADLGAFAYVNRCTHREANPYFHKAGEEFHNHCQKHVHDCLPNAVFVRAVTGGTVVWDGSVGEHPE